MDQIYREEEGNDLSLNNYRCAFSLYTLYEKRHLRTFIAEYHPGFVNTTVTNYACISFDERLTRDGKNVCLRGLYPRNDAPT